MSNLSSEQIVIDKIKIPRDRKVDDRVVKQLMESIKKIGLLEPVILCRPARSMGIHLVAGRNRIEAFKRLKIKTIPARVEEGDTPEVQQWRELAEIDENLIRRDMSSALRAKLTARRKVVYEAANPDIKSNKRPSQPGTPAFTQATHEKTGRTKSAIKNDVRRGRELGDEALEKVRGTSLDTDRELDALIKMDADERAEIIARAARGEDVTARPPEPTPGYAKLNAAWEAASPAAREKFKAEHGFT